MNDCGVYTFAQLVARGLSRNQIRHRVATGDLVALRRGWYATNTADAEVVRVVRAGGVLGCVSALRRHGVWVPESAAVATHVRGNSTTERRGQRGLCHQYGRSEPVGGPVDAVPIALRHAVKCLDAEGLVVVCDSILNKRLLSMADLRGELSTAPSGIRELLGRCDGRAQSGPETMVRCRLRARRIQVDIQVRIEGVGWVDLLVGERLIIEVDGDRFHRTKAQLEEDQRRDRVATTLGYRTMRLSYTAVVFDWETVEQQILAVIRSGGHKWPRRTG